MLPILQACQIGESALNTWQGKLDIQYDAVHIKSIEGAEGAL